MLARTLMGMFYAQALFRFLQFLPFLQFVIVLGGCGCALLKGIVGSAGWLHISNSSERVSDLFGFTKHAGRPVTQPGVT